MSSTNPGSARPRTVVAGNDRRVQQLEPGQLPRGSASRPQAGQGSGVDRVEDPPRGRIRGHQPEQGRLLPQHRQIRDGLATVGQ
jgi:hypothetical protein